MEPIEFKDIRYILAVENAGSFSRAAEKEYISQPALSRIVKKVEQELGLVIFDRGSFPLKLTPEGREVMVYFRKMLEVRKELEEYCDMRMRQKDRVVTIGAPSYFCRYVLPPIIDSFRLEHPDYQIRIIETNDNELREFLRTGAADLGISVGNSMPSDLRNIDLAEETIVLAVPAALKVNERLKDFRLTAQEMRDGRYKEESCPKVRISEFKEERFLMLKEGNDMYLRGMKICREAGFVPNVVMQLDQLLSAYYLAAAGQGITFTRASIPHFVGGNDQVFFYKIDHPETNRPVSIYFSGRTRIEEILKPFTDYVRECCRAL